MKFAVAFFLGVASAVKIEKDYDASPKYFTPFDKDATYYER